MSDPYDATFFREAGHRLVDQLADYLERVQRREGDVLPHLPPLETAPSYAGPLPEHGQRGTPDDFTRITARVIDQCNHLHHPRYVGHQVAPPVLVSALGELVSGVLNQSMAVYEMGPAPTHVERQTVRWLCEAVGWPDTSDGVFTSGGSLGNLTALLVARQVAQARRGGRPLHRPAILVSEQAHYSVGRSARILGLGDDPVIPVGVDEHFRMRPHALEAAWQEARREGRDIVAVAASACTTATGSFDPLREIGAFCREHDLWLHVDGAHGASVLFSDRYRGLVDGIDQADSIAWDAHKMLFVPGIATAVLFRDASHGYETCSQEATYLFGRTRAETDFDIGLRTIECTKRMLAWKLWLALQWHGREGLASLVDATLDRARSFARLIEAEPDFELWGPPQANIVCFRHTPPGLADPDLLDALQARVRQRILESGRFYLVQARIGARLFLRTTLMNVRTTDDDLASLLQTVREAGGHQRIPPLQER